MFARQVILWCLSLLLLLTSSAYALRPDRTLDQSRLDTWSVRDGLPPFDTNAIAQTPDGFLWLGTGAGLVRFDGAHFAVFNRSNTPGLRTNAIISLLVDRDGVLWLGTEWGGFGRFVDGRFLQCGDPEVNHWNYTTQLYQDRSGDIWRASLRGIEVSHRTGSGRGAGPDSSSTAAGHLASGFIPEDSTGDTWNVDRIATSWRWSEGKKVEGWTGTGFAEMPNGDMLCSTDEAGIVLVPRRPSGWGKAYVLYPNLGLSRWHLSSISRTADGSIYCTSSNPGGLLRIEKGKLTVLCNKPPISTTLLDREGRIWLGTSKGLLQYSRGKFREWRLYDGLNTTRVQAVAEDREGNLWVSTEGGLRRFADTPLMAIPLAASDAGLWVNRLSPDGAHGILAATSAGVKHVEMGPGGDSIQSWDIGPGVSSVGRCRNGDILTVGRDARGSWRLMSIHGRKIDSVPFPDRYGELSAIEPDGDAMDLVTRDYVLVAHGLHIDKAVPHVDGYVFQAKHDANGVLWIGAESGLLRWAGSDVVTQNVGLPTWTHVISVDPGELGCVWLGTDRGLGRWENGKIVMYDSAGLPSSNLLQVARTVDGTIWAGGPDGVFSVREEDLRKFDRREIRTVPTVSYQPSDGFLKMPVGFGGTRTSDGAVWMAEPGGVTRIDPADLGKNELPPPVVITNALMDRTALSPERSTVVSAGPGTLQVHFAALSFAAPERVRIRYRLEGFDSDWVEADAAHNAFYQHLPPGHYRFRVIACNNSGVWNRPGTSMSFTLRPHYYQTTWFRAVEAAVSILAVLSLFGLRLRGIIHRAQELERVVERRTEDLKHANDHLTDLHHEVECQNEELVEIQSELIAQNQELVATQETLAEANTRLEALATTDGLTGILNHRSFRERLKHEWTRFERNSTPISLILLDVDRFKQYNDAYGHPAGDEVLRRVAIILEESGRDGNVVCRYGGEEFVVIAPDTDAAGAMALAERLRLAIETEHWPHLSVTASFGVSTTRIAEHSIDDLIVRADTAMYHSKRAGRNRVTYGFADVAGSVNQ